MTPDEKRIVEWLRAGGEFPSEKWQGAGFKPTLGQRLQAAWLSFCQPWSFAQCGQVSAADAIERGDHRNPEREHSGKIAG